MTELSFNTHRDQLNRQLAWQEVLSQFYNDLTVQNKKIAANRRAYGDLTPESSPTAPSKIAALADANLRCTSADDLYFRIACPHDAAIKRAQREGDAAQHKALLDQANSIIEQMNGLTIYGVYEQI